MTNNQDKLMINRYIHLLEKILRNFRMYAVHLRSQSFNRALFLAHSVLEFSNYTVYFSYLGVYFLFVLNETNSFKLGNI